MKKNKQKIIYIGIGLLVVAIVLIFLIKSTASCPSSIIPERIQLNCTNNGVCEAIKNQGQPINYEWRDHMKINGRELLFYTMPYKGYNINYRYSVNNITYTKTQIDKQGNVIEEKSYFIRLAIDPKDETKNGFKIVYSQCLEYIKNNT